MVSNGRDFPAKVWPMAFSNCRRARKSRKSAPDGQHFKAPTAALLIDLVNNTLQMFAEKVKCPDFQSGFVKKIIPVIIIVILVIIIVIRAIKSELGGYAVGNIIRHIEAQVIP